jgi:hypothetical protein
MCDADMFTRKSSLRWRFRRFRRSNGLSSANPFPAVIDECMCAAAEGHVASLFHFLGSLFPHLMAMHDKAMDM